MEMQIYTVPLSVGIDQKTDKKTLGPKLAVLENAYYKKNDRLSKMPGFDEISILDTAGVAIDGRALETFENELLMTSDTALYSYSKTKDRWTSKGSYYPINLETKRMSSAGYFYAETQTWVIGGIRCIVTAAYSKLSISLYDEASDTLLFDSGQITDLVSSVRLLELSGSFYVLYQKTVPDTISCIIVNPATYSVSAPTVLVSNAGCVVFDALVSGSNFFLSYGRNDAKTSFSWWNSSLVKQTGSLTEVVLNFHANVSACELASNGDLIIAYGGYQAGPDHQAARAVIFDSSFAVLKADQLLEAFSNDSSILSVTVAYTSLYFDIYYERDNGSDIFIEKVRYTRGAATYAAAVYATYWADIVSKAMYFDGKYFLLMQSISESQPSYFLLDQDFEVLARIHPENAAGYLPASGFATATFQRIGDSFYVSLPYRVALSGYSVPIYDSLGVSVNRIDFGVAEYFRGAELSGNLHIPGGLLHAYDGVNLVEHGFLQAPELVTVNKVLVGGQPLYSFSYVAVYEWVDAKGNTHRSQPSLPFVTSHNARGTGSVTVKIRKIFFTRKTRVLIKLYGTTQDGTIHYLLTSVDNQDGSTVFEFNARDLLITATDADIVSREILYTQGGILPNFCPPACKYATVFNNRLFLAGLDDKFMSMYSKEIEPGGPVEFSGDFSFVIDREGGPITAQGVIDDKLITFKRDLLYVSYGFGPDKLGGGSYYPSPQLIPSNSGCIDQRSVENVKEGLIYKSEQGFQLLLSSLDQSPIGLPVEDFDELSVTSVTRNKDESNVIFTHSDGLSLVFDYLRGQWSTFTPFKGIDSLQWQGKTVVLEDGKIHLENKAIYQTFYGTNAIALETGWISLSDINGFQRIQRATLTADYRGAHIVTLKVGYDYSDEWDEYLFDSSLELDPADYSPAKLISRNPKGGEGIPYKFEAHLEQQKCSSIRFRLEESIPTPLVGTGEGLSMTSLSLLVGIKKGVSKNKTRIGD